MLNSFQKWAGLEVSEFGLTTRPIGNWVVIETASGNFVAEAMSEAEVRAVCKRWAAT